MQSSGSSPPVPSEPSGVSVPGPSSTGSVANGGGAAASGETKPRNQVKAAYGPDMDIIEVTNDGVPENMEMLIHLKVSTDRRVCVVLLLFARRCACFLLLQPPMGVSIDPHSTTSGARGVLLLRHVSEQLHNVQGVCRAS